MTTNIVTVIRKHTDWYINLTFFVRRRTYFEAEACFRASQILNVTALSLGQQKRRQEVDEEKNIRKKEKEKNKYKKESWADTNGR